MLDEMAEADDPALDPRVGRSESLRESFAPLQRHFLSPYLSNLFD